LEENLLILRLEKVSFIKLLKKIYLKIFSNNFIVSNSNLKLAKSIASSVDKKGIPNNQRGIL